jgi:hypothetical protein
MKRRTSKRMIATLMLLLAACSSAADELDEPAADSAARDEVGTPAATDDSSDGVFTPTDELGPLPPPLPDDALVSDSVLDPIEPVPDTGVPGIESDDVFCRSWSEFAGSYQALTFAWAIQGGEAAARLEVVATDVLTSAVERMGQSLPSELEADRQALTVDLPAPLLRRAERAREILSTSGVDDATIESLGQAWLAAVTDAGLESETLAVPIDDIQLNGSVAESALMLLEELPPITEDPSLIVDVDISTTEEYLFENCPDRGVLAGNDRVDTP